MSIRWELKRNSGLSTCVIYAFCIRNADYKYWTQLLFELNRWKCCFGRGKNGLSRPDAGYVYFDNNEKFSLMSWMLGQRDEFFNRWTLLSIIALPMTSHP